MVNEDKRLILLHEGQKVYVNKSFYLSVLTRTNKLCSHLKRLLTLRQSKQKVKPVLPPNGLLLKLYVRITDLNPTSENFQYEVGSLEEKL